MKILIPDELPYSVGVENVVLAIVREWISEVERITWIVRDWERARELGEKIGTDSNLDFEVFHGNESPPTQVIKRTTLFELFKSCVKKIPILQHQVYTAYRHGIDRRIAQAVQDSGATHCWYHFVQGQSVPQLSVPIAGLVHDQNFRFYPENLPKGKGDQFQKALLGWLRNADMLTVLSQAGKQEILELEPSPISRIEIIPNAISPPDKPYPVASAEFPYFLYPASALAHKNHLLLFQAALLMSEIPCEYKIILCGQDTEKFNQVQPLQNRGVELARQFYQQHRDALAPRFEFKGNCSSEELDRLYSAARAVVLPSKYEGFGLPLVESLVRNTPVFCSQLVPFCEQVERYRAQDWVRFFSLEDPTSLANLLTEELKFSKYSSSLGAFPLDHFTTWTWSDVASKYFSLFSDLDQSQRKAHLASL